MGLQEETGSAGEDEKPSADGDTAAEEPEPDQKKTPKRRLSCYLWAMLIARLFDLCPLQCPRCSSPMKVRAVVTDRDEVRRLLESLGEPTEPPRIEPARGPPQGDFELDQTLGQPEDDAWT